MNVKQILIGLVVLAVALVLAVLYVRSNEAQTRIALTNQLESQEEVLRELAEAVYRNQDDALVKAYVRDCTSAARAEFDANLDNLSTLTASELDRTQVLFEACASFFADKKSASVAQLRLAYAHYHQLIDVFSIIDRRTHKRLKTEDWELFIGFEQQLADLLRQQLPLQRDIISLLEDGVSIQDQAIKDKIKEAQSISESASVLSRQTDVVYNRLMN